MRMLTQALTFIAIVFVSTPSWARLWEGMDKYVLLECVNFEKHEVVAEVYDLTGSGIFLIGFRSDNGEIESLPVEQKEMSYISKRGSAFFNIALNHIEADQYQFSAYEAELHGNGTEVVSPVNLVCKSPID
jgi:hypothetical protein